MVGYLLFQLLIRDQTSCVMVTARRLTIVKASKSDMNIKL